MEIKCTGLKVGHTKFSYNAKDSIKLIANYVRNDFKEKNRDNEWMIFGVGFSDNEKLIWAIESATTELEFNSKQNSWVNEGLRFLAEVDYDRYEKSRYDNPS